MKHLQALAKVFSDENRLLIFALIIKYDELCVCEICDTLELSQPLVSRHLKMMKEHKVFSSRPSGKWVVYTWVKENTFLEYWIKGVQPFLEGLPALKACDLKS